MPSDVTIRYERTDDIIHLTIRGATSHELREVMVGLWKRLEPADQADHIEELRHYLGPESWLSPVARVIATGEASDTAITIKRGPNDGQ